MNTTISSNGLPQLPLPTTSAETSGSAQTSNTSSSGATSVQANDSVNLTDSARALHQASSTDSPVDTARVEQIKKALSEGTYQVDPNAIANNLLSMENQISSK
jgi:negative regulator of flagellin synthesis FlgM